LDQLLLNALVVQESDSFSALFDVWKKAWVELLNSGAVKGDMLHAYCKEEEGYSRVGHAVHNVFNDLANPTQKDQAKGLLVNTSRAKPKPKPQKRRMKSKPTLPPISSDRVLKPADQAPKKPRAYFDTASRKPEETIVSAVDRMQASALEEALLGQHKERTVQRTISLSGKDPFAAICIKYGDIVLQSVVNVFAETAIAAAFDNRGHSYVVKQLNERLKELLKYSKAPDSSDDECNARQMRINERLRFISKRIKSYGVSKSYLIALPNYMSLEQRDLFFKLLTQMGDRRAYMGVKKGVISHREWSDFLKYQKAERKRINAKKQTGKMPYDWHLRVAYTCEAYEPDQDVSIIEEWNGFSFLQKQLNFDKH